jgi:hypothetical protein
MVQDMSKSWLPVSLLAALALAGCKPKAETPLAPPDSYLLFVPAGQGAATRGDTLPVSRANLATEAVKPIPSLFETGFGSEMLRTVYLAGQFLREATVDGQSFSAEARRNGAWPVCLVVGVERVPYGRGLSIEGGGWFSGSREISGLPWLGLPSHPAQDKALVQTLAGRLAAYAAHLVATAGLLDQAAAPPPATLVDGYRMAIEVVAREWRHREGPAGTIQVEEGTTAQRELFANVRENRFVAADDSQRMLLGAKELLASPGVAATVLYRMAQSKTVGSHVAPKGFYEPFAKNRMPPGISPALILGTFRNFQAKLLGVWASAVLRGKAPQDIADLVEIYGAAFPDERAEVIRIFVVTTFGGTVKPGGCSMDPKDGRHTLAELTALSAEVGVGRKTLRDALAAKAE